MSLQIGSHPHNALPVRGRYRLHFVELSLRPVGFTPPQMAFAPFRLQNLTSLGNAEPLRGRFVRLEFILGHNFFPHTVFAEPETAGESQRYSILCIPTTACLFLITFRHKKPRNQLGGQSLVSSSKDVHVMDAPPRSLNHGRAYGQN